MMSRWSRLRPLAAEHAATAMLAVLLVFFSVVFLHWSFGDFIALFNSDSAANVLFGHEIVAQRTPFPQWNDSTWIFFPLIVPNLALLPLTEAFMPDWFSAFRLAAAIDQALMFALLWWALQRAGLSTAGRLCLLAFLVIGPSWQFLWLTTGIAQKSWLFGYTVVLALCCRELMQTQGTGANARWMLALVVAGGMIFADIGNAANILPGLMGAMTLAWLVDPEQGARRRCMVIGASLLAACIGGWIVRHALLASSHYVPFAPGFTDLSEAGGHLGVFMRGLLEQFGAVPAAGTSPYSIRGAASGAKCVLLLVIVVLPTWLACSPRRLSNPFARLLAVTCTVSWAIGLYVYLFTGISVDSTGTARYFILEILLGATVCLFYLEEQVRDRGIAATAALLLLLPFAVTAPALSPPEAPSKDRMLATILENQGLDLGYAGFWNANAPTALSSGRLRVRPVEFIGGTIRPMRWLSSDHWYAGDRAAQSSFLLLGAEDVNRDLSRFYALMGQPHRRIDLGHGFTALVYPFDLALRMAWPPVPGS